jgi:hypothetical protein
MTRLLPVLALLIGCSGAFENEVGGPKGSNSGGYDGAQSCWDLNWNGEADANEDTNGDGVVDVYDCRGGDGSGSSGNDGQDCWDLDGDGVGDPEEDTNGDGVVDVYDCRDDGGDDTGGGAYSDYYLGSLEIDRPEGVDAFCERYTGVIGDMVVEVDGDAIDRLDCLVEVIGDLSLREVNFADSTDFDLQGLAAVTGTLNVITSGTVEFDQLLHVGGALELSGWSDFGAVAYSFPLLEDVGLGQRAGGISYVGSDGTTSDSWSGFDQSVSCPSLTEVNGDLVLTVSKGLQDLNGLASVDTIGGNLTIQGSRQLIDVTGLHGVAVVGGYVTIRNNPSLPTSAAETLVAEIDVIGGTVTIEGNGPG